MNRCPYIDCTLILPRRAKGAESRAKSLKAAWLALYRGPGHAAAGLQRPPNLGEQIAVILILLTLLLLILPWLHSLIFG